MQIAPIVFGIYCAFGVACSTSDSTSQPPAKSTTSKKDPATARKLVADGAVVIDVRTANEFGEGHLPNATNIPVQELPGRLSEVAALVGNDKARPIVVYCAAGARAGKAKTLLDDAGYSRVVNGGGLDDLR